MHEFGIAQHLVEAVSEEMALRPDSRLLRAHVSVGALRQIVPESLSFAYEAITRETTLVGSSLEITSLPVLIACRACGLRGPTEGGIYRCAACGAPDVEVVQGMELYLDRLVIDEE